MTETDPSLTNWGLYKYTGEQRKKTKKGAKARGIVKLRGATEE